MDYEKILKRSWQITKSHKKLWIFGMVLATLSGGSGFQSNLRLPSNFFSEEQGKSIFEIPETPPIQNLPQQTTQVLGAATDTITDFFSNIPISVWIIVGITILIAIFLVIAITLFIREWARGALIASIHDTEDQKPPTLRQGSLHGISSAKRFIALHIIPGLLFTILIIALALVFGALVFLIKATITRTLLAIVGSLIFIVFLVGGGMLLVFTIILAEQVIIRKNLTTKEAVKKGFKLAKQHIFKMLGMGAIHLGLGCAVGCLTIIVVITLIAIIAIAFVINKTAGILTAIMIGIPIVALLLLSVLIRGIFLVFKTSNWTLLAREIETLELKENPQEKNKEGSKK